MIEQSRQRWIDGALVPVAVNMGDSVAATEAERIIAADSWLVQDGASLALDLHRQRFRSATVGAGVSQAEFDGFWTAALAAIPRSGNWFPRVERIFAAGREEFILKVRPAPKLTRSLRLATHRGPDPRTAPTIKGPDTLALLAARSAVAAVGADEAIILSDHAVVEGAYSAILWWRGEVLCSPAVELERVNSVTARSVLGLATALGVETYYEAVTPAQLDGCEIWSLGALHGIRIVTHWVDGPASAESPGRLALWRARLDRLLKPLP